MSEIQVKKFEEELDLDFACELPDGSARFRVNVFFQRGGVGLGFTADTFKYPQSIRA